LTKSGKVLMRLEDLAKFKPHPKNPRNHSPEQIEEIAESIRRYGFLRAVVVWRGLILAGEGSAKAAKIAGVKSVPVVLADHLSEREAVEFMLSDNKLNQLSEWNLDLLREDLPKLSEKDLQEMTDGIKAQIPPGFEPAEIIAALTGEVRLDKHLRSAKAADVRASLQKTLKVTCKKCGFVNVVEA
jgi:ParB-like chromosome segregation protein Spo0J